MSYKKYNRKIFEEQISIPKSRESEKLNKTFRTFRLAQIYFLMIS